MSTAYYADRIIDGTGAPPINGGVIVVDRGTITEVGRRESTEVPHDAVSVDLEDSTILPGLIDMHGHLTGRPPDPVHHRWSMGEARLRDGDLDEDTKYTMPVVRDTLLAVNGVLIDLLSGVTTLRDVGENTMMGFTYRKAAQIGVVPSPRLLVAGVGIKAMHGHGLNCQGFSGVEEVRAAVRRNLDAGADVIKLFVTGGINDASTAAVRTYMSREEVAVAVKEAHRQGVPVAAHAHGGEGLRFALEEGCDTIEHAALLSQEDIPLFIETGAFLVTTCCVMWNPRGIDPRRLKNKVLADKVNRVKEQFPSAFMAAVEAGVRVCVGTDARHGLLPYEMQLLNEFGMDPMKVIMAATSVAAEACGLLDEVGTLEVGKRADLISVAGNPLEDISAIADVGAIVLDGKRVDGLKPF